MPNRCAWARNDLSIHYHDAEWGVPQHDDHVLFEFIVLEGAQAGLSWDTVLKKRARYREVFAGFDPAKVARFTPARVDKLLLDPGIIRHRGKIESAIKNAKAFLKVQAEFGTFDAYIWRFIDSNRAPGASRGAGHPSPRINSWPTLKHIPAKTPESDAMSKDLKRRGFTFVGSTICYAFMQAVGMVNDHPLDCDWHVRVQRS
ncbi:MAG: DNA-3-methyladenine glycosylase I [Planctomycetota bacterium]